MLTKRFFNMAVYCLILVVPLVPVVKKIGIIPVSADFIFGGLAIFFALLVLIFDKNKEKIKSLKEDKNLFKLTVVICIFLLLSILSVVYAKNKISTITETMRFMEYIILFYSIILISDEKFIQKALVLFIIAMTIASVYGILQFVLNLSSFKDDGIPFNRGRIYSTFVNPNYWGAAINIIIYYPIIKIIDKNSKGKVIYVGLFLLFMMNLFLTFTRGSWVGFIVGILLLALFEYKKVLLILPVGAIATFVVPSFRNRFISIFNPNNLTNNERFKLWKTGLLMFKDHFLTGVGNGNYLSMYGTYMKKYPSLYMNRDKFTVHNSYIKMFAELGIFGGISFIAVYGLLFYIIYHAYKNVKDKKYKMYMLAFLCSLGAYFFQNFFNNLMFIPQLNIFIWIISAIMYKYFIIEKAKLN